MAITLADFLGTSETVQTQTNQCSCPVCIELNCLQRPRFFAGQLISETDLNGEINYVLAKQRLHNRFLHGVGTVCGLEVVCNSCAGYVTVKPGYAISACGDDIIVCQEQAFNVMKAINDCCSSRKNKTACDPYQPAADPGCTGLEQRWCITIKYVETPAQAVTPLRPPQKTCSCGGNCGGSCGCGGSKSNGNSTTGSSACGCNASSTVSTAPAPVQCEPTRILESYQLGIVPDPGNCDTPASLLGGTLFANLVGCLTQLTAFTSQLSAQSLQIVGLAVAGNLPNSQITDAAAYTACCQLRQIVLTLFSNSGSITRCQAVSAYEAAACPAPPNQQGDPPDVPYLTAIQTSIQASLSALFEFLRECVCHDLLPPCPADPGDDRLILACLTVRDGEIVDICNFGCRQFAGGFPSFSYWLSAIPIVPLIKAVVGALCCGTELKRQGVVRGAMVAKGVSPVESVFMESNFALPKTWLQTMGDFAQKFSWDGLTSSVPVGQLNLATLGGMSTQNAAQTLKTFGVTSETVMVNSRAEIPLSRASFKSFAKQGDHVVIYQSGDTILAVQPAAPAASAQAVADLRSQLESLRSDVATLKKAVPLKKK
jgi:hypothetical protein